MLVQELQHPAEMGDVGGPVPAEDEDVVEVDEDKGDAIEDPVHHPLERLGGVLQTKRHLQKTQRGQRGL